MCIYNKKRKKTVFTFDACKPVVGDLKNKTRSL